MLTYRTRCLIGALALLQLSTFSTIRAAAQAARIPHTSVVVFADRPVRDEQWASLFAGLHTGLVRGGAETQALDQNADFVRGQDIGPGLLVDSAITVYLHGDCTLRPVAFRTAFGVPLGWVFQVDGRIQPFVHVDCAAIADVLGSHARGLGDGKRTELMGEAMARVVLHEWIHVATQSGAHAVRGIEKAQFGAEDLMGEMRCSPWLRSGQ